jgi:flavin-dependent dehydrogenase
LAQAGAHVVVVDRKVFPRDKTCAGWVTPQVFEVLGIDPADYGLGRVCQPITGFQTGMIGGNEVHTDYGRIVSYGIRRCEFDHFILERAAVSCRLGEAVRDLKRSDEGWILNGQIAAKMIVGAGGHFCPVARALGGRNGDRLVTIAAQEIEYQIRGGAPPGSIRAEIPELYFCPDLAGYGWCFRKGDYLNIGLGRLDAGEENSAGVASHVQSFCRFLRERGTIASDPPQRFHGHAYRLYEKVRPQLVEDRALLIGDAAGLAYPQSGEGIRPAVESGLMAADAILEARGDYSRAGLEPYAARIVKRFGIPRGRGASAWLPAAFLHFAAAGLMSNRWFTRRVVLDGWFLHAQTPTMRLAPARSTCVAP